MNRLIEGNKYMVIEPYYSKGGVNYFDYENKPRGYSIMFSNKEFKDNCVTYMPMDKCNFRIFVKKINRYSEKAISKINDFIDENQERLFDMYSKMEKNEIFKFLKQEFKE